MQRRQMSERKKKIIASLIEEYDIKSTDDIQEAMKDLLGETMQNLLEVEMDEHLGYAPYERSENENSRNGYKSKTLRSKYGELPISVPQDRESEFEPKIVGKNKKDITKIDDKIIGMYAKGLSVAQISEQVEDIYGFEVSEGMVSNITNKILPMIDEWQNRPLSGVYPIIFIDGIVFSVRDNNIIKKMTAYVILGINADGKREVLSINIGESESAKYWLSVLNELKNRGVADILVICADGLSGIKEAIVTSTTLLWLPYLL